MLRSPSLSTKDKVGTPPVHTLMEDVNQVDLSRGLTDVPMRTTRQNVSFDPSLSINCKFVYYSPKLF